MEKDNIKTGLIFLLLSLLVGCSSVVTNEKINRIMKKQSKIDCKDEIIRLKEVYDNYPDLKKDFIESGESDFNKSMALRNKVLDSIKILNYERSIIIESTKDLNGLIVSTQYFFFGNKIYSAGYDTEIVTKNGKGVIVKEKPVIKEIFIESLKANYQNDILEIYNHFNQDAFSKIKDSFDCTPTFGSYKVTIIIENKIGYYGVKAKEKCSVETFHNE